MTLITSRASCDAKKNTLYDICCVNHVTLKSVRADYETCCIGAYLGRLGGIRQAGGRGRDGGRPLKWLICAYSAPTSDYFFLGGYFFVGGHIFWEPFLVGGHSFLWEATTYIQASFLADSTRFKEFLAFSWHILMKDLVLNQHRPIVNPHFGC